MAEVKDDSNKEDRWPWDYKKEELTPAVLDKIIKFLPSCALDATCDKTEEVGVSDSVYVDFQAYCYAVKDNFEKKTKEAPDSNKPKLSGIATEAFGLVDLLVEWVEKTIRRNDSGINARYMPIDDPCSHTELASRWDTVVRKFDLCRSSQGAQNGASPVGRKHGKGKLNEKVKDHLEEHRKLTASVLVDKIYDTQNMDAKERNSKIYCVTGTEAWKENRKRLEKEKKTNKIVRK